MTASNLTKNSTRMALRIDELESVLPTHLFSSLDAEPISLASQIVNGMNYRFELDVTTASGPRAITLVMYENGDPDHVHREISSVTGL